MVSDVVCRPKNCAIPGAIMDPDKRQMRELKRAIKRAGNKRRRHQLKRDLADNPDEAHNSEVELTRDSSAWLNGLDRDSTRRRGENRPTPN
jgi:hypothetical protein